MYKLKNWIDNNKIKLERIVFNINAIDLIEKNIDKINFSYLSYNPNAIHLLKKNSQKIDWIFLSGNKNAINILHLCTIKTPTFQNIKIINNFLMFFFY